VLHALWLCPVARDVWGAGAVIFQKSNFKGPTFLHVMEHMIQRCTLEEMLQFASIARRIWLRRNEVIHGGVFAHPRTLLKLLVEATEAFQVANAPQVVLATTGGETRIQNQWIAPSPGWVKINWDATIDKKKGCIGLGAIIRDSTGKVLAAHGIVREGLS
jgi:hypothetical protein